MMSKNEGMVPAIQFENAVRPENIRDSDCGFVLTVRPTGKAVSLTTHPTFPLTTMQKKAVSHKCIGKEEINILNQRVLSPFLPLSPGPREKLYAYLYKQVRDSSSKRKIAVQSIRPSQQLLSIMARAIKNFLILRSRLKSPGIIQSHRGPSCCPLVSEKQGTKSIPPTINKYKIRIQMVFKKDGQGRVKNSASKRSNQRSRVIRFGLPPFLCSEDPILRKHANSKPSAPFGLFSIRSQYSLSLRGTLPTGRSRPSPCMEYMLLK